ncbi:MAG TPA: hypothetical protein VEQ41_05515 [Solirubrobacterales bacterium]|nr:hypothetical protein [Solirubrobacterales bacterium]
MSDLTHVKIDDLEAIDGFFEGIKFHKAAAGLGVSSFGISIIDLAPGAEDYPEHDHSPDGIGGQMFAKRPEQLGQEEVYHRPARLRHGRSRWRAIRARRRPRRARRA